MTNKDTNQNLNMISLRERLNVKNFVVTTEINPPKGPDATAVLEKASMLKNYVDAINVTDSAGANMAMAPITIAHYLTTLNISPILQITGRDRNRIAIQGELLAAHALGISNVLCMSGDSPADGDHPEAKGVFDLDATGILQSLEALRSGFDLSKSKLNAPADFLVGAVVNPGAKDIEKEITRMQQKIDLGAQFFQTQGIFDTNQFESFMEKIANFKTPILAGLILLKSAKMAQYLNDNLFGVNVPDKIIQTMDASDNRIQTSIDIASSIIESMKPMCSGVHIMAIGWESHIPKILQNTNLT